MAKTIAPQLYQKTGEKRSRAPGHDESEMDRSYFPADNGGRSQIICETMGGHSVITFDDVMENEVRWRWTVDWKYSTKSAYPIQFTGTFSKTKITPFCMDLIAQKRILAANNLLKCSWTDDMDCRLCGNDPETPVHLCKDCPFTKEVWGIIKQWFQL